MRGAAFWALCVFVLAAAPARAQEGEPLRPALEQIQKAGSLQPFFEEARRQRVPLILPAGTFLFKHELVVDGIHVSGQGAQTVLKGTLKDRSAVLVTGRGARLADLAVSYEGDKRSSADGSALVLVGEAEGFTLEGLSLSGGESVGIFVRASGPGKILRNRIEGTLADGIHITARSHDILVEGNVLRNTGDDGIAVVSYMKNGGLSRNIDIVRNLVADSRGGRGIAVVGGAQVRIGENEIFCKDGLAGVLVASESAFKTYGTQAVAVIGNKIDGCGGAASGHGAVTVSRDNEDHDGVWIESNYVTASPAAALMVEGRKNRNLLIKDNGFAGFGEGPMVFRQEQVGAILSGNSNRPPAWVAEKQKNKRGWP